MFCFIIDFVGSTHIIGLFIILIIWTAKDIANERKIKRLYPPNKLPVIEKKQLTKICTRYQPFRTGKKEYTICNFICDGNCHLTEYKEGL